MVVAEDAGLGKDVERALRSLDVELVARRAIEGTGRIRADLGRDTELREKLERTTGDRGGRQVEVKRDRAPPRRCTVPAVWKSAEISARRSQRRVGAIAASSARTFSASEPELRARLPRARADDA